MWEQEDKNSWTYKTDRAFYRIMRDDAGYQGEFALYGDMCSLWLKGETIRTATEGDVRQLLLRATASFIGEVEEQLLETTILDGVWREHSADANSRVWLAKKGAQSLYFYWYHNNAQYKVVFNSGDDRVVQTTSVSIGYTDYDAQKTLNSVRETIPDWIMIEDKIDIAFNNPPLLE